MVLLSLFPLEYSCGTEKTVLESNYRCTDMYSLAVAFTICALLLWWCMSHLKSVAKNFLNVNKIPSLETLLYFGHSWGKIFFFFLFLRRPLHLPGFCCSWCRRVRVWECMIIYRKRKFKWYRIVMFDENEGVMKWSLLGGSCAVRGVSSWWCCCTSALVDMLGNAIAGSNLGCIWSLGPNYCLWDA